MGCGGSKSTAVSERTPLVEDKGKTMEERPGKEEKTTSGYSKLPQEEDKTDAPAETGDKQDAAPPSADPDVEENSPPEKTTTRYTKLPPSEEDKGPGESQEEGEAPADKPEPIAEEEEAEKSEE